MPPANASYPGNRQKSSKSSTKSHSKAAEPDVREGYLAPDVTVWSYAEAAAFAECSKATIYQWASMVKGSPLDFKVRNRGKRKISRAKFCDWLACRGGRR